MTIVKFALVGLLNTAIGFAIILAALSAGLNDYAANALGYGLGLIISYSLNRYWTFSVHSSRSLSELMLFSGAFAVAYLANLLVLTSFRAAGYIDKPLAHLSGLIVYSALFYLLSRYVVFGDDKRAFAPVIGSFLRRRGVDLVLCFTAIVTWGVLHDIPINHDVTWQYWIARQLFGGAQLYRDIWEINPPLWFWSAVPIQYIGELFQVPPLRVMIPIVIGVGATSALAVGNLVSFATPIRRLAVMLLTFSLTTIVPVYDFGQREQLALICALPYAALIARRFSGLTTSTVVAGLIGLCAAYGFALKHFFILIPLALEVWLIFGRPRWRPVRPETLALAISAVIYAASVIIFAPEFFTSIVPMVGVAYHGYENSWDEVLLRPWTLTWVGIAAFFLIYGGAFGRRAEPVISALLIVAIGFAVAYFVQSKGWPYHSLSVTGAGALALGIRLGLVDIRHIMPRCIGFAILTIPLISSFQTGLYSNHLREQLDVEMRKISAGERVFIATTYPRWIWPAIEDYDLVWSSRLYTYWMIPAIAHGEVEGPNPPKLQKLGKLIQKEAELEILCSAPALVVFERRRASAYQPPSFDVREYLFRNTDIRDYLKINYKEVGSAGAVYIYRRVTNIEPLTMVSCPNFN